MSGSPPRSWNWLGAKIGYLSLLFHEARHSDGHGRSATFQHAICPKGHAYEGRPSCDEMSNGAYTVHWLIVENFLAACSACTLRDRTYLRGMIASMKAAVLPAATTRADAGMNQSAWDDEPEGVLGFHR